MSWGRGARGVNEYSYQGSEKGAAFDLTCRTQINTLSCGFKEQFGALWATFKKHAVTQGCHRGVGEKTEIPTSGASVQPDLSHNLPD